MQHLLLLHHYKIKVLVTKCELDTDNPTQFLGEATLSCGSSMSMWGFFEVCLLLDLPIIPLSKSKVGE